MIQQSAKPGTPARPSPAVRLRQATIALLLLGAAVVAAAWTWKQPVMEKPRMAWMLWRSPPPAALAMPVRGVRARQVAGTFGAPRGRDREHAGVDIFAARGSAVVAATPGIVSSIRDGGLGGKQVWVLGPSLERHYYAHLDDWAPGLEVGQVVHPGDRLGSVGDTGNARGTPAHLHYGIYGRQGAYDPLPLLRAGP